MRFAILLTAGALMAACGDDYDPVYDCDQAASCTISQGTVVTQKERIECIQEAEATWENEPEGAAKDEVRRIWDKCKEKTSCEYLACWQEI